MGGARASGAIERLASYDATGFHPVGPGDVRARVVHVFAHGWQPGYRVRERLLATADGVPALPAWDPRLVDATGRVLISDYLPLLAALAGLGPDHAVLWYSWLDSSATDADVFQAFRSRQATQVNGRRLAVAVQHAVGPHRPRLHLIGHSHGSAVVTHAALSLTGPPEQLTLLDAPEDAISRVGGANDMIDVVLPRLRPGRGRGFTFVDSYASAFGRPYHHRPGLADVVDVLLGAPLVLSRDPVAAINAAHLYPVDWYARSVRAALAGGPRVGYGWSPLAGGDPAALHSWYHAPLPARPLMLRRHVADAVTAWGARATARLVPPRPASPRRALPGVRIDVDAPTPTAAVVVTSRLGEHLVEFDLRLTGCRGGERVALDLDGVPGFLADPVHPVPAAGRYLLLVDGPPGEHLVTVRLLPDPDAPLPASARACVDGLRLVGGPRPARGFTLGRSAAAVFAAGAVTGSAATVVVGTAAGLAGRRLVAAIGRARAAGR